MSLSTLQLATRYLGEILEDNYGVLSTTRRLLVRRLLAVLGRAAPHRIHIGRVGDSLGMSTD